MAWNLNILKRLKLNNIRGEILLQHRIDNSLWGLLGGAVELGETVKQAAVREVFEEIGIEAQKLKLSGVYSGQDTYYKYPNGDEVYWITVAFTSNEFNDKIRPDNYGSKECKFFSIEKLPENLNPIDKLVIDDYLKVQMSFTIWNMLIYQYRNWRV